MPGNGERERNSGRGSEVRKHLEIAYLRGQTNLRLNGHEEMGVHLNSDGEILSYGGIGCGWADPKERHAIFLCCKAGVAAALGTDRSPGAGGGGPEHGVGGGRFFHRLQCVANSRRRGFFSVEHWHVTGIHVYSFVALIRAWYTSCPVS